MKVLFEDREVQLLLDDFQSLVGVRIAVFDTDFIELYSSPKNSSSFCSHIRKDVNINNACKYCDQKAFRKAKINKDTYIYKCHLGLCESVTPIFDNKQVLGYVMIGQILGEGSKKSQWAKILDKYPMDSDEKELSQIYFYGLKQMTILEIEAHSRIMKACAASIWLQHIIDIERSPISEKIKNYIAENYTEPLNTNRICSDLNISKTTIYNYLKKEYNQSLNQYINVVRLEEAKEIIQNSNKTIAQIACDVGFEDYNYFSRKFKEKYKITPSAYRKID